MEQAVSLPTVDNDSLVALRYALAMSDQRVSRRSADDDAARLLHAAARERLAVALVDLFLPNRLRLSEWHRTTMQMLLERLVRSVEDELRASFAAAFADNLELNAALTSPQIDIALPILMSSRALQDPELVALLFRRVEEHRLYRASLLAPAEDEPLLQALLRDRDEALSAAAMAFLIGQNRRLDRFLEPVIASPELPAELEHRLVWTVAAALRTYMVDRHHIAPADADRALAVAAARRIYAYDEGEGLEARSLGLARRLNDLRRLSGDVIRRALAEGNLTLFLACLSLRCDLGTDAVWEMLFDPDGRGAPVLLRAASLEREEAGGILLLLGAIPALSEEALLEAQLDLFDTQSPEEARTALRLWQTDSAYRAAISHVRTPAVSAVVR